MGKKKVKNGLGKRIFGFFFAILSIFMLLAPMMVPTTVYADPTESETTSTTSTAVSTGDGCQSSLGAIGWLVCPTTGKIAEAVDWLYDKIEGILAINPLSGEDGSPIYEIWKYCRGLTNIVFIIFLLVVIYSQITGVGVSNYGIKKALPKLIVAAILMNLSFLICTLAVDVSNIVGNSLRGVFDSVAAAAVPADSGMTTETKMMNAEMFSAIAGGTALTIGAGVIAFETGAIWMLIPVVLGAIVAVAIGLITIALRQAVVALLVMISPLAIVAYILPNTEHLFKKWKQLLTQMLVFYPMFSMLFGASSLAGFAIIMSATDGFGVLLGTAVQIFPLFFAWKLMQMSGTFLGDINAKMRQITASPLAKNRAWASSKQASAKQKHLAAGRATTPSLRLMQFMANRKIAQNAEDAENAELVKNRALAYRARRNYDRNGVPTKQGMESYENVARALEYQRVIERDKNNMNNGLSPLVAAKDVKGTTKKRLEALDNRMVAAADTLKFEKARGEKIEIDNAEGFYKRTEAAMNWHMDQTNGYTTNVLEDGQTVAIPRKDYKFHMNPNSEDAVEAATKYAAMSEVMNGNTADVQFAAANAAQAYDTQNKILTTKYQKYFEMTPSTKDLKGRLKEISTHAVRNTDGTFKVKVSDNIDTIVSGLRVLNQRGDTDVVKEVMDDVMNEDYGGLELGTHASQSLANFLMFEVKDKDPFLRRFGKYINLETARIYNGNERQVMNVTYDEYIKGYHDGEPSGRLYAKKGLKELMEGTGLENIERTALGNLDSSLMKAYSYVGGDGKKHLDLDKYFGKREEIQAAMAPQFISASAKYVSGSEQLKSAVEFLTGYKMSQKKEKYVDANGNEQWRIATDENGEPEYEWKTVWEGDSVFKDDPKKAEDYYRARTLEFVKGQTPTQFLGSRSDYREALMEHFAEEYFVKNPEERAKYEKEKAEIQTMYGDDEPAVAQSKRKKDLTKLKEKYTKRQILKLLGETGKLEQIYRSRRSGAANNAKDWVRKWTNLDDENALFKEVKYYRNKQKKEWEEEMKAKKAADPDFDYGTSGKVYDENDQLRFKTEMEEVNDKYGDDSTETFFKKTKAKLDKFFGKNNFVTYQYDDYYHQNDYLTNADLYDWIKEMLNDLDSYPGNE